METFSPGDGPGIWHLRGRAFGIVSYDGCLQKCYKNMLEVMWFYIIQLTVFNILYHLTSLAGTGFFSGSSIQGRVKNWLLMVFRWSSACLWNSINRYLKASFFHAPHFIYFHSMNLTSQSARRDDLFRWLSCSKIISYIYIYIYI